MARFSLENDQRQNTENDVNNPYNTSRNLADAETQAAKSEAPKNDDKSSGINSLEESPQAGWTTNVQGGKKAQDFKATDIKNPGAFLNKLRKRGPLGAIAAVLITFVLVSLLGPTFMLPNLAQSFLYKNNGLETTFNHRALKVIGTKMSGQNQFCDAKHIRCKMGMMSTKGFKKLEKKGIIAYDEDGNKLSDSDSRYPKKPVVRYSVQGVSDNIQAKDIRKQLANNPKLAAKVFGRVGAFNLRFEAWSGKYLKNNFFDRWRIKRNGGIADGSNDPDTRPNKTLALLKERFPTVSNLTEDASKKIRAKSDKMISRGKRGGLGYLTAVATCATVKMPGMIAYGVAAVQLARILPLVSDVILSPGSKIQASYITNPTPRDAAVAADLLTATDANGKSALDSKYLQSAIGVNTAKTGLSEKFTPGYSMLNNELIRTLKKGEDFLEPACNAVLSPAAMYSAIAVNTTITVLASSTIVLGIVKIGAEIVVTNIISGILDEAIGAGAEKVINELAENDALDRVLDGQPGEELGDALGISAMAFASTAAASRHVPVLKESDLVAFEAAKNKYEDYERQMDLASLSPFDISSKHTFLGSIVYNANMFAISNGGYKGISYLQSIASYVATAPLNIFTKSANANDPPDMNYCSYASELGMNGEDKSPAVNAAGLPCHGYMGNIPTMTAIDIVEGMNSDNEPWLIDEAVRDDKNPDEGGVDLEANLMDIVKEDSRLYDYLRDCGPEAIDNGEWNDTALGCTLDIDYDKATKKNLDDILCTETRTENCVQVEEGVDVTIESKESDATEAEAMAAFAIDYQISQAIDGNDEDDGEFNAIGGPSTPAPESSNLPSGTNQELAKKIIESGKVDGDQIVMRQIQAYADTGKPSSGYNNRECHVNPTIMKMLYELSTVHHIYLTSLNRYCINYLTASGSSSYHWRDGGGHAVDIGIVDGMVSTGATRNDIKLIKYISSKLPSGSMVGQLDCRTRIGVTLTLPIRQFDDTCNHIHFNVPIEMAS